MLIRSLVTSLVFLSSTLAFSHGDHPPPAQLVKCKNATSCTKEEAIDGASKAFSEILQSGKLDATWKGVPHDNVELKSFDGKQEWVVSYKNPKVANKEKQVLYIFLSQNGSMSGMNYTGK